MRNITVTVDDETYRLARMKAAERDTSVSALVKEFLRGISSDESGSEKLRREEKILRERVTGFKASDNLSRNQLHRQGG